MPDTDSAGEIIPVDTEIVAVTVYPEQARVTRQGQLEVHQSPVTLDIGPLPATLDLNSIQAYARGTARVTVQKPTLKPLHHNDDRRHQEGALNDRFHQAEDQFHQCKDTIAGLQQQQAFLQSLADESARTLAQGLAQQTTDLVQVSEFTRFLEQAHESASEAIVLQERRKQQLDQQLQQARQALQQFQASNKTPKHHILLPLILQQPGTVELSIVYDVTEAQWQPAYDVRLQAEHPSLQIDCIAEVQQDTGEDWQGVDFKVSTAVPDKTPAIPDASLPNLQSTLDAKGKKTSGISRLQRKSGRAVLDEAYRMLGALPGSEIPPEKEDDGLGDTMLQPANVIICFVAPAPGQVPSDGEVHRVPVGQLQLESRLAYVALPQRCSSAYLCAALTNPPDKWPLLPGTAYLFRDGGYVGAETFDYVGPGASFQLSLGLDERVAVQRELVTQKTEPSKADRDLRAYRLTIRNPFDHVIDVTVIEQIPISRSEEVVVQITHAEPSTKLNQKGQCQWLVQLAPQTVEHIFYEYEVKHPPDVTLSSLSP
ncbi:MAG: mucoidy inhibitor MuiA family protein [Cyanobacteria bacterium P01_D01_bin.6]